MSNKLDQKRTYWAQHVSAWQKTNLSQQAYCQKHSLRPHQLSYWKNKPVITHDQPAKVTASSQAQETTFVPVEISLQEDVLDLIIQFPNGARITGVNTRTVSVVALLMKAAL